MNTKEKNQRSLLENLRQIRDNMSLEIQDMSFEELSEYLKNKKSLHPKWAETQAGKKE